MKLTQCSNAPGADKATKHTGLSAQFDSLGTMFSAAGCAPAARMARPSRRHRSELLISNPLFTSSMATASIFDAPAGPSSTEAFVGDAAQEESADAQAESSTATLSVEVRTMAGEVVCEPMQIEGPIAGQALKEVVRAHITVPVSTKMILLLGPEELSDEQVFDEGVVVLSLVIARNPRSRLYRQLGRQHPSQCAQLS